MKNTCFTTMAAKGARAVLLGFAALIGLPVMAPRTLNGRLRLSALVAVCLTALACGRTLSAADDAPAWLVQERQAQYAHLEKLIQDSVNDRRSTELFASQVFRPESLILASDRDPLDVLLRRTQALLAHLQRMKGATGLAAHEATLRQLSADAAATSPSDAAERRRLFDRLAALRRNIAFANPLLNFDRILFIKRPFLRSTDDAGRRSERFGNHCCQQYYGFYADKAGGLFVLEGAFGAAPAARDLLANAVCLSGRFKGGKLPPGGYLSPDLSFDANTILFAFTEAEPIHQWNEKTAYHIFRVNADGSGLTQLTDGPFNDFDPCWLPNGRIVFISERRGGFGRCHPSPKPSYTLHSMKSDGSDIVCLSFHESNEWQPSVDNHGMIVYTRWDYVDRGSLQAHHPWLTTPDGRDARALAGNYGKTAVGRPHMTMDLRAIPGSPRYVTTAAAHHGQAYGSLVMVDPQVEDDDDMSPFKRLTPEALFPETEPGNHTMFATPWPLSEEFYLCVYDAEGKGPYLRHAREREYYLKRGRDNNFGLYLVDAFGNRELLYRDPALSCLSPIPLIARSCPPTIPHKTAVGKPATDAEVPTDTGATVGVVNVYDSRNAWPAGTKIKALRIMQVLPKTTSRFHSPPIGYSPQNGARAVLGTVPVEADGSAFFRLPAGKPVFFQAIDERGLAVQSMRSATYVHPGEQLVCRGCHEARHQAPLNPEVFPAAFRRAPSEIVPDVDGSRPFSYPRLVQPVLDRHCVACHEKEPKAIKLGKGDVPGNLDAVRAVKRDYFNPRLERMGLDERTRQKVLKGTDAVALYWANRTGRPAAEWYTQVCIGLSDDEILSLERRDSLDSMELKEARAESAAAREALADAKKAGKDSRGITDLEIAAQKARKKVDSLERISSVAPLVKSLAPADRAALERYLESIGAPLPNGELLKDAVAKFGKNSPEAHAAEMAEAAIEAQLKTNKGAPGINALRQMRNAPQNPNGWYTSYINLEPFAFYFRSGFWNAPRTTAGKFGARASRLLEILEEGHYDVKLPPEDLHRLTLWLDCNSDFFGSYENTDAQSRGEIVWPTLE